jgi:CO/xanthine dehydrogenase FAD-binding subunit
MIIEYHRPQKLAEALALLSRQTPKTKPLAGGTNIAHMRRRQFAVVDLQALGLDKIIQSGKVFSIGSMATLQQIVNETKIASELREIALLETSRNLRNMGTIGGSLVTADGRSMITAALLCLDTQLVIEPGCKKIPIQDWLNRKKNEYQGCLITSVEIPNRNFIFDCVRKTPKDLPLLSILISKFKKDELRIVIGGKCTQPFLVPDNHNLKKKLEDGYAKYQFKEISKEYFCQVSSLMIDRMKENLK